ncbi:MAG: hypothetical protein GY928_29025 [Colwellia sp.]|nr:hypothetical protein [Colwellia sp.]
MYELMQEVQVLDERCTIVGKKEEVGKKTVYTLKDSSGDTLKVKESNRFITALYTSPPPNAFTHEEFMKMYNASPYLCTGLKELKELQEFVEECFRSKNV